MQMLEAIPEHVHNTALQHTIIGTLKYLMYSPRYKIR